MKIIFLLNKILRDMGGRRLYFFKGLSLLEICFISLFWKVDCSRIKVKFREIRVMKLGEFWGYIKS